MRIIGSHEIKSPMNNHSNMTKTLVRWLSGIDLIMLTALCFLIGIGLFTLYSASDAKMSDVTRQQLHFGVGFAVMLVAVIVPSKLLQSLAVWLYVLFILLLVAVLLVGDVGKGAQRWLDLGVIRFQPSEFMKIILPLMVARYFADKPLPPKFIDLLVASMVIALPVLLIARQPDLGTALLVALAGFFVIYFAGISWKYLIGLLITALVTAPLLFFYGMHDYQQRRVLTLLDPTQDKLGSGYHILQSMIAIGSGGVEGKGWLHGDQSHLDFLPERHTDFIFAVYGEEFGLIGNIALLLLYLFIIWRGLYLASRGQDTFSRLLAGSLAMSFFLYLFVNTAMVSGLLPVVGVPLPLVSYGGTSVVALMLAFGLIMGLRKRKRVY